jgi:hypothetical protein
VTGGELGAIVWGAVALLHGVRHLIRDLTYRNRLDAQRLELDAAREALELVADARELDPRLADEFAARVDADLTSSTLPPALGRVTPTRPSAR